MGRYFKTPRERRLYRWSSPSWTACSPSDPRRYHELRVQGADLPGDHRAERDEEECGDRIGAFRRRKKRFDYIVLPETEARALREKYGTRPISPW
jgi:hypothetical protein